MMRLLQTIHWPNPVRRQPAGAPGLGFNIDANGYNAKPFPREGEQLIDALVARNMPIDLAHGSEILPNGIMNRVPKGYSLDSHQVRTPAAARPRSTDFGTDVLDREKEFLITERILLPTSATRSWSGCGPHRSTSMTHQAGK